MEILKEEPITNVEAKEIMEKRAKEVEFGYEQNNALEHLRKFATQDPEKIKKLKEELQTISKLKPQHIVAICNFLPQDKEDLKVVLYKDYTLLSEDEANKIIEIVKKFV